MPNSVDDATSLADLRYVGSNMFSEALRPITAANESERPSLKIFPPDFRNWRTRHELLKQATRVQQGQSQSLTEVARCHGLSRSNPTRNY
jgi:hypothetical protein